MNILQIWFGSFILLIVALFILFYKALKSGEKKYRYWIVVVFVLMVILSFIPM